MDIKKFIKRCPSCKKVRIELSDLYNMHILPCRRMRIRCNCLARSSQISVVFPNNGASQIKHKANFAILNTITVWNTTEHLQ